MIERFWLVAGLALVALAIYALILGFALITDWADYLEWSPPEQAFYRNKILSYVLVLVTPGFVIVIGNRLDRLGWPLWCAFPATILFGLSFFWDPAGLALLGVLTILLIGRPARGTSRYD